MVSLPKGRFPVIVAHIIMAATMNNAGIVKFRKLSMPMISVKATATITYRPPSISPLISC